MEALLDNNSTLSFDEEHQIIYHQHDSDTKVRLVAGPFSSFWKPTCFGKLVGADLLSAAIIPFTDSQTPTTEDPEQTSYGFRLEQFEAALRACGPNEETSMLEIHPNWALRDPPLGFFTLDSMLDSGGQSSRVTKLTISDDAQFVKSAQIGPCASEAGREGGAGTVLAMKICGALAAMNYGAAEVGRVGNLVDKNLISMNVMETAGTLLMDHLPDTVTSRLKTMLDQGNKDQAFVNVNSNEPVLLINNLGGLSATDLGLVTDEVLKQLQETWSVWPVRIYAGSYMESRKDKGFSISILNVVNTDIGGPNMIQLLDAPCNAPGWESDFVRKESWNGRTMLGRYEGVVNLPERDRTLPLSVKPVSCELDTEEKEVDTSSPGSADAPLSPADVAHNDTASSVDQCVQDAQIGLETPPSPSKSPQNAAVEQIGEPEINQTAPSFIPENLPTLPDILHPTWEHDEGGESLLDMIKRQAQRLGLSSTETNDKAEGDPVHSASEVKTSDAPKEASLEDETPSPQPVLEGSELSSEDEFEAI